MVELASIDLTVLLDNVESIVSSAVAILGIIATILLWFKKEKAAAKVKEFKVVIEDNKKEIEDSAKALKTIIEGVDKAKDVFRPIVSGEKKFVQPNMNVGEIIAKTAENQGTKIILDTYIKKFGGDK